MTVGEKRPAVSDLRLPLARCAAANCHELAKRVFIADFQISRLTAIFQVLGFLADGAVSVKLVFRSNLRRSTERDVMLEPAIWAKYNIGADYAIRSNSRARTDSLF